MSKNKQSLLRLMWAMVPLINKQFVKVLFGCCQTHLNTRVEYFIDFLVPFLVD
jgi:hypothetical protein